MQSQWKQYLIDLKHNFVFALTQASFPCSFILSSRTTPCPFLDTSGPILIIWKNINVSMKPKCCMKTVVASIASIYFAWRCDIYFLSVPCNLVLAFFYNISLLSTAFLLTLWSISYVNYHLLKPCFRTYHSLLLPLGNILHSSAFFTSFYIIHIDIVLAVQVPSFILLTVKVWALLNLSAVVIRTFWRTHARQKSLNTCCR